MGLTSLQGQHFFYKTNGTEFFIKGVAYQQDVGTNTTASDDATYTDPLADEAGCQRDIPLLQAMGVNVIRVYAINASLSHDACMTLLQSAGIYVIQDLSNPSNSINRNSPSWNTELFAGYAAVVDAMSGYSNTLGYFAGNEVSNEVNNTAASAYVKAAVRDMKSYIKAKNYREIGVGYATNDDAAIRDPLANYFNCGDASDAIDFWGYNIYSWCGRSSYTESGFDQRTAEFANYSVPAFFAEYGCNTVQPRVFTEVGAIYGSNMTDVWSGGIMYMYFQEANDYGIVSVSGSTASKLPDYTALSRQLASVTPSFTNAASYAPTNSAARSCPTVGSTWAASSKLPPIANAELCSCMVSSLSCVAASGISSNTTAENFAYLCGLNNGAYCAGITGNGTTGVYGAYSMCSATEQLSFVMNTYYESQNKAATACSFSGAGKIQKASTASTCSALLSQAGTSGTGTVTSVATATGGSSSSSSSAASSSQAAAGQLSVPAFDNGMFKMGAYIIVAILTGAGMLLL